MSTRFWVINDSGEIIEVAFRSEYIRFTNPIASMLPIDTEVIPMDNTPQWIFTIRDLKMAINNQYAVSSNE